MKRFIESLLQHDLCIKGETIKLWQMMHIKFLFTLLESKAS